MKNNNDINYWDQTGDLSGEYNPVPKPEKKAKAVKKRVQAGVRTLMWKSAHPVLDGIFVQHGIIGCEIRLGWLCVGDSHGYAHKIKRGNYTPEEMIDPHVNVRACNPCHDYTEYEMPKEESEKLLGDIIKKRGW